MADQAVPTEKVVEIPFNPNKAQGHRAARVEPGSP